MSLLDIAEKVLDTKIRLYEVKAKLERPRHYCKEIGVPLFTTEDYHKLIGKYSKIRIRNPLKSILTNLEEIDKLLLDLPSLTSAVLHDNESFSREHGKISENYTGLQEECEELEKENEQLIAILEGREF